MIILKPDFTVTEATANIFSMLHKESGRAKDTCFMFGLLRCSQPCVCTCEART